MAAEWGAQAGAPSDRFGGAAASWIPHRVSPGGVPDAESAPQPVMVKMTAFPPGLPGPPSCFPFPGLRPHSSGLLTQPFLRPGADVPPVPTAAPLPGNALPPLPSQALPASKT